VRHSFGLVFIGCALLFPLISPMSVLAQTIQPGKYTGRVQFVFMGKPVSHMATLTVEKVADERIWGVAWLGGELCRVDTPVQGRIEGGVLKLWGNPVKEGCGIRWELKFVGNKLEGTLANGGTVTLSK